jgi:hypothetical protein
MNLLVILLSLLTSSQFDDVTRLQWADPDHKPITYQEYLQKAGPSQPYNATEVNHSGNSAQQHLLIITNSALYLEIQDMLVNEFIPQLIAEQWEIWVVAASGGEPTDLRSTIENYYQRDQITTVFLIGDLPVAWCHLNDDYEHGNTEDFPMDLYYTALNATFLDEDHDGMVENYLGDIAPVISLGRLVPSVITHYLGKSQADLINRYLAKDLDYRKGNRALNAKALIYADDAFAGEGTLWNDAVKLAYPDTTLVNDYYTTWASDYMNRWEDKYEHIFLLAHSSPLLHRFFHPDMTFSNVFYYDVASRLPKAYFYNLFACSNCNFTEDNCMGLYYILHEGEDGLIAIGSTKIGSMQEPQTFYEPLSTGKSWGEALRIWFCQVGIQDPSWFYGMTCLGDPTLCLRSSVHPSPYQLCLLAQITNGDVKLSWAGYFGTTIYYNIYRVNGESLGAQVDLSKFTPMAAQPLIGNGQDMHFFDRGVLPGKTYTWFLGAATSPDQKYLLAGNASLTVPQQLIRLSLARPKPNPAKTLVQFEISLDTSMQARLEIHDLAGRLVKRSDISITSSGKSTLSWDLLDESGNKVANGIYTVSLINGNDVVRQKVLVAR